MNYLRYSFLVAVLSVSMVGAVERPQVEKKAVDPIFVAVANGDIDKLRILIRDEKVDPNTRDDKGNTPLLYANSLETVKALVDFGADVNAKNNDGIAKLHMDVVKGQPKIVNYLLEKGADANSATKTGVTPLHFATMISYFERPIEVAITGAGIGLVAGTAAAGAAMVATAELMAAAAAGATTAAAEAVIVGGPVAVGAAAAVVAIIAAVDIKIRNNIVEALIQKGAKPNAQDNDGNAPLHTLAAGKVLKPTNRHGGRIMAKHLIKAGARKDITNKKGQTPYDVAVEYKRVFLKPILKVR